MASRYNKRAVRSLQLLSSTIPQRNILRCSIAFFSNCQLLNIFSIGFSGISGCSCGISGSGLVGSSSFLNPVTGNLLYLLNELKFICVFLFVVVVLKQPV